MSGNSVGSNDDDGVTSGELNAELIGCISGEKTDEVERSEDNPDNVTRVDNTATAGVSDPFSSDRTGSPSSSVSVKLRGSLAAVIL